MIFGETISGFHYVQLQRIESESRQVDRRCFFKIVEDHDSLKDFLCDCMRERDGWIADRTNQCDY